MAEDSGHSRPSSHRRNYGSGDVSQSNEGNPLNETQATGHFRSTPSNNRSKLTGPWHQNQVVSPRDVRQCESIPHHHSGDIGEPKHQSSSACHPHDKYTHNVFRPQRGNCSQLAGADVDHSNNGSVGWLEDKNFVCPQTAMHASGYKNARKRMHPTNHVIQKRHCNERREQYHRRPYVDSCSPWYQENNLRGNADYREKYGATCHNRADQEASYDHNSYDDHMGNNVPNHLHHSEMDGYIELTNVSGSTHKVVNPTKNSQEHFHRNVNLMEDEEEDDDDDDSDSEKDVAVEKMHQKLLPKVKEAVDKVCGSAKPSLVGNVELSCLVCSPLQYFKGWKALLAHAQSFRKRRVIQHRGYYLALDSLLRVKEEQGQGQEQEMPIAARASFIDSNLSESHLIVWPPVVVIENMGSRKLLSESQVTPNGTQITQGGGTMEDATIQTLLSLELQDLHPTDFISCGRTQSIILFEASSLGYMEAKVMNDRLCEGKRGREDFLHFTDHGHSYLLTQYYGRTSLLFGYLAEPADLKIIDPYRAIVKDWSEESYWEKVQGASKRMKQEHAHKQAKLKAMELEVVTLSEEEQNIKIHRKAISWQIQIKGKEIEKHQDRTRVMREHFAEEDRRLFEMFEAGVSRVDKEGSAIERDLREQLERDEKLHEEERISRMKQIQLRHLTLQELKKGYEKLAEEKALDRETEVMVKRKIFMEEVRKAEADFIAEIQGVESSLQAEQQEEMEKLAEESEREREDFYRAWMKENETMKKEVEDLKTNKEKVQKEKETPECVVCWEYLTPENRALLAPCGHTQVCVQCAQKVFTTQKECPLCRQKIAKRPMLCPTSLLGVSLEIDLKKNKEQVHRENEKAQECAICWESLTLENRALLAPCGHTQVCIECAQAVFTTTKECPLCRQKIIKKPIRCPKSLLGAS